jgi:hypothetical protein
MKPGFICQDMSTCRINDTGVQIIVCSDREKLHDLKTGVWLAV